MEIIQFSTTHCPPCKTLRRNVESSYNLKDINYLWVDCVHIGEYDKRIQSLYYHLKDQRKLNKVPTVVLLNGQEILDLVVSPGMGVIHNFVSRIKQGQNGNPLIELNGIERTIDTSIPKLNESTEEEE